LQATWDTPDIVLQTISREPTDLGAQGYGLPMMLMQHLYDGFVTDAVPLPLRRSFPARRNGASRG
jgi:hypothetical protein